jgi:SsrA-binding protein
MRPFINVIEATFSAFGQSSHGRINNMSIKVIATNRKARYDYYLYDTYEAGISLLGSEIKSVRAGQVSIKESYVRVDGEQAWLVDAHISPYDQANRYNHEPRRPRKLLLHKKEIRKIYDEVRRKSVTVIPIRLYLKDGLAKVEIAVARGKKKFDKRQAITERDTQRIIDRQLHRREY